MASLKAENAGSAEKVTSQLSEETKEISPTVEESVPLPDDQDIVTPLTESEKKEIFVSDENEEEKEKKAYEEEEDDPEALLTEEAAPDHSTEKVSRAIHEFTGGEEDEDDEDDKD